MGTLDVGDMKNDYCAWSGQPMTGRTVQLSIRIRMKE